jgi:hypothetical protein
MIQLTRRLRMPGETACCAKQVANGFEKISSPSVLQHIFPKMELHRPDDYSLNFIVFLGLCSRTLCRRLLILRLLLARQLPAVEVTYTHGQIRREG